MNLFIQNKYTNIYYSIISKAQSQDRKKSKEHYFESHHIIPKSLGGTNDKSNLVLLTAREHFICHYLLCKMVVPESVVWIKLQKAFNMMNSSSKTNNRYINSRLYESQKQNFSKAQSVCQSGSKNSNFGKVWVTKGFENIKIDSKDLDQYTLSGYTKGRSMSKRTIKRTFNKMSYKLSNKIYYCGKIWNIAKSDSLKKLGFNINNFYVFEFEKIKVNLEDLYWNKGYTFLEISNLFCIHIRIVQRYFYLLEIKTRS